MNNLAFVYHKQNRLEEAAALQARTLEIKRRVMGNKHFETLRSLANLGFVLQDQGRLQEAESLLVEAYQTGVATLGSDHPGTYRAIYRLARVTALQNKRDEALGWLRRAVEHGFSDASKIKEDPALDSLREDIDFKAIVAEVENRAEQER
jgi:tetratricopeptide (TPR) repeat protein